MLISVTLGYECIKKPRCKFCFLKIENAVNKLKSKTEEDSFYLSEYSVANIIRSIVNDNKNNTICFEYNGYGLSDMDYCIENIWSSINTINFTMTTIPQTINPILCGFLKKDKIEAIALSFDSEKIPFDNSTKTYYTGKWEEAAMQIKMAGIKLSCNYLIEPYIGLNIPEKVLELSDQINLLSYKPTGKFSEKGIEKLKDAISYLNTIKPITTDNCLGVQLGNIKDCRKGKDFIHVYPDGSTKDCCFQNRCYLWK